VTRIRYVKVQTRIAFPSEVPTGRHIRMKSTHCMRHRRRCSPRWQFLCRLAHGLSATFIGTFSGFAPASLRWRAPSLRSADWHRRRRGARCAIKAPNMACLMLRRRFVCPRLRLL
jgi:hypothetical protein